MSWQLGSLVVLLAALAAGFTWYERRRPSTRVVALVATLAALAALGRIAFAPLPNVKPTTDIVLLAGYALGGGPGFVVGALAALTSNFFFGQGPWTAWQMAGWALTGVAGAALAVVVGPRIRRWALAAVCGVVGFAFTVLQDVGDWVNFSDHSAAQLRVYVARGIGFDLVHAVGCVGFALLLGPGFAASLERFARRTQFTWSAVVILPLLLVLALPAPHAGAASTPAGFLLAAENRDGGLGAARGQPSSPLFSGWAALGLASRGIAPPAALLDYVQRASGPRADPGTLERTILALRAAGRPAGRLLTALERDIGRDGSVHEQVNLTAFAMLALRAGDAPVPSRTQAWLRRQQDADGGFSFATAPAQSDADDTGAVLEALRDTSPRLVRRAIAFLRAQQNDDGGWPSQPGADSNAQSTAWAVQGVLAAGRPVEALSRRGHTPLAYLRSLLAPDGHVRYSHASDQTPVWVTAEAMMALAQRPLPLVGAPTPARAPPVARKPPALGGTSASAPRHRSPHRAHVRRARRRVQHARRQRARIPRAMPVSVDTLAAGTGVLTALAMSL